MLAPYAALWRIPGVPRLILFALVARVPFGLVGLSLLFLVREETGSFATAGSATGAYGLAMALGSPVVGRLVDRFGQPRVLIPLAVAQALALGGVVALALGGAPGSLLVAGSAVAGAVMPPLQAAIRALWPSTAGDLAPTAFALEAILLDVFFILGPMLAAAITAAASPQAAVLTGAALGLVGVVGYATAPAPRAWRGSAGERPRGGALASRAVRALVVLSVLNGAMFGFVELALPAFAEDEGSGQSAGGVLIGLLSVGSVLGGVAYGAWEHRRPLLRRAVELSSLLAAGFALLLLPGDVVLMGAACVVAGLALAPLTTVIFQLIDLVAPRALRVEANTWLAAASAGGVSAGAAVGGALVEEVGVTAPFVACLACAAAAPLWLLARRRVLDPGAAGAAAAS